MKKIKWGLIGCGKVVLKNETTPFINKNNTITAICTTSMTTAENAKKKLALKNCNCYTNIQDMLLNNNIDCIYIATPPKYHFMHLKILSKYNIPIYVEKPFVINFAEAKAIKSLYNKNQLVFIAHYKRLTKQVSIIKKIIDKKKIGDIISVHGIFDRQFNEELYKNSWIYNSDISGGGRFIDIAPHILDTLYYLFGEMKIINSNVVYDNIHNTEEIVKANINFDKTNCDLNFNFNSKYDIDKLIINGTKGKLITSINRDFNIYISYNNGKSKTIHLPKPKTWGIESINEINRVILKKKSKKRLCTIEEACLIQNYIDLIMKK